MDVTVVVGTFGDRAWIDLAQERAIPSADALDVEVIHIHGATLHEARNAGLDLVTTKDVCFLDADDELEAGYFEHMATVDADLRAPAVRYIRAHGAQDPWMPQVAGHDHACTADCLPWGNWLVIGTVAPAELVRNVGGFRDFDWSEDWDLWVRCWQAGATIAPVPLAIYRAHVRSHSRNRGPARSDRLAQHRSIAEANGLPVPA